MLEERRDALMRVAVIQAELKRIGKVEIHFGTDGDGEVTEERLFLSVSPLNSSVGKLMQAYTGMGGNPYDISMFLTPNSVELVEVGGEEVLRFTEPSGGVLFAKSGSLAFGGEVYEQGDSSLLKYSFKRVGGRRELGNEGDAMQILRGRRWMEKEIRYKRNSLEERIIKLCDLREQLEEELRMITCAVAETVNLQTLYAPEGGTEGPSYLRSSSVAAIAARFDGIIWTTENTAGILVADTSEFNTEGLADHVNIMSDAEGGEEDWSAC
jgi:hypothetical protein